MHTLHTQPLQNLHIQCIFCTLNHCSFCTSSAFSAQSTTAVSAHAVHFLHTQPLQFLHVQCIFCTPNQCIFCTLNQHSESPGKLYEIFKFIHVDSRKFSTTIAKSIIDSQRFTSPNLSLQNPCLINLHKLMLRVGTDLSVLTEILISYCKI